MLKPGESMKTPPSAHTGYSPQIKDVKPKGFDIVHPELGPWSYPIAQFSELWYYAWSRPGEFRVRAVYNHTPRQAVAESFPGMYCPWEVRVVSPWVKVRVSR